MRSLTWAGLASMAMLVAACGGGDSGGPQTEQGAMDAVAQAQRGLLDGDADDVLGFMSAECRATVDDDEVKLGLALIRGLMGDSDLDLGAIEVNTSIEEFDGDTAEVQVEYIVPDGGELDDFLFSTETYDVIYEDGKWVSDECEFGDDSEIAADELADQLAAAGLVGTRDDPVPANAAAPVGRGFTVSIDAIDTDAYDAIEAAGGYVGEPEAGNQVVMIDVTIGYGGSEEPVGVGDVYFTGVGGTSSVGVDFYGCSGIEIDLDAYNTALMSGGVTSGAICGEVPSDDIAGLLMNVGPSFSDNTVFFDPAVSATSPTSVSGSVGLSSDGDLADKRAEPIAVGTATDVGEGWTVTVNGLNPDVAGTLAANEYNDPAPAGSSYVLVDLTLDYVGDESSAATAVELHVVGDSNVASRAGSCSVTWDGELDRFSELFSGGTLSGELCFLAPSDDVDSLQLLASADYGEEPEVLAVG